MCGRFSQSESSRRLAAIFDAQLAGGLPAGKYNVAPTDEIRIVLQRRSERLKSSIGGWLATTVGALVC